eukprot:TRINITY_DN15826_c0_g1_i1.p1 TRINITY_DN15826_c0_g1~~TRINITY_DN15826_c0_g1_i1.p1  ORF type:complete len:392 (+),score=32.07 TRINITY_DN15826_c0_g1_i1:64-1239(+)
MAISHSCVGPLLAHPRGACLSVAGIRKTPSFFLKRPIAARERPSVERSDMSSCWPFLTPVAIAALGTVAVGAGVSYSIVPLGNTRSVGRHKRWSSVIQTGRAVCIVKCDTNSPGKDIGFNVPISREFHEYLSAARLHPGPRVAAFLEAVSRRGNPCEVLASGGSAGAVCGDAMLDLLHYADFASGISRETFSTKSPDTCVIALFERFVQASHAVGGIPRGWASACRNSISIAFAFALLSEANAKELVAFLRSHGVTRLLDPIAGTGFHALLLHNAGIDVTASDVSPATAASGGMEWFLTQPMSVEHVDWTAWRGQDAALLLSWPPRWSTAGADALSAFHGDHFVFIGDNGQWTGCAEFHSLLARDWVQIFQLDIAHWPHMTDDVRVYKRRK